MKSLASLILCIFCIQSVLSEISPSRYDRKYKKPADGILTVEDLEKTNPGPKLVAAVNPSYGIPWPLPQQISLGSANLSATPDQLKFSTTYQCDILTQAIARYQKLIFTNNASGEDMNNYGSSKSKSSPPSSSVGQVFTTLTIVIDQPCEKLPYLGMNENYTLSVWANGTGVLHSGAIWGALRGLETFSHMFFTLDIKNWQLRTGEITDYPRFAHRGILLDTSRHFLSVGNIKKNLDLMMQNKFNVFHWHIVDDQSFPYTSQVFPDLIKGAYTPNHVYTVGNMADVVEYARVRGIRVVAEFDTPGHTLSWGVGQPGLLTPCYSNGKPDGTYGPIDPSNVANYNFLLALFTEILNSVFPDRFVHLGGDEVDFTCCLLYLVVRARNDTGYLVWQEVVDNGVVVKPDTVVHVWKGNNQLEWGAELNSVTGKGLTSLLSSCWYLNYISYGIDWYPYYQCDPQNFNVWKDAYVLELQSLTKRGYKAILSSCWYLNEISYGTDWYPYYQCDPQIFPGTQAQKDLVIGGEACMWGEYVDDTNLLPRMWPRASPVAERLWSSASLTDVNQAAPRLEEHRCRLLRRGYPVESVNGPGFCPTEWTG